MKLVDYYQEFGIEVRVPSICKTAELWVSYMTSYSWYYLSWKIIIVIIIIIIIIIISPFRIVPSFIPGIRTDVDKSIRRRSRSLRKFA